MAGALDFQEDGRTPLRQYLDADRVIEELGQGGAGRVLNRTGAQIFVLALLAGGLITAGAQFSVLLAAGVEPAGLERLLEGVAFSVGFFFVILSGAVLFTEANVAMPATLLQHGSRKLGLKVLRFWTLAWLGNLTGAVLIGLAINAAQNYGPIEQGLLLDVINRKLAYREAGGAGAWGQLVLSGVLDGRDGCLLRDDGPHDHWQVRAGAPGRDALRRWQFSA